MSTDNCPVFYLLLVFFKRDSFGQEILEKTHYLGLILCPAAMPHSTLWKQRPCIVPVQVPPSSPWAPGEVQREKQFVNLLHTNNILMA